MPLTLGMTGMDSATEAALKAAVAEANANLGQPWQVLPEAQADHVVVDMDSMYGPMSWLRLHAAGKQVIGLSSAMRTQTDFHLSRPFDAASVTALLEQAATAMDAAPASPDQPPEDVVTADAQADGIETILPKDSLTESPAPQPDPAGENVQAITPPADMSRPDADETDMSEPAVTAPVEPPPPRERRLAEWLAPGALSGRVRYRPAGGEILLIDADKRQYRGPIALKGLRGHYQDVLEREAFIPLDDDAWAAESATLGQAQPLSRLQWYGGLLAGNGTLLPGYDPDARYRLGKWPQTEREFPKHFRLATTMMKGPATLVEIAEASGVPLKDVADFINASLASGYAEFVPEPPPEPAESPKSSGLFGRFRGK